MPQTPNAASVALIEHRRVLLIQRARAPWLGSWSLPGGRREPGETPEACAARELREELGVAVFALRPVIQLKMGEADRFLLQVYATDAFGGAVTPNDEIADFRWIEPAEASQLPTTPQLPEVLAAAFRLFDRS